MKQALNLWLQLFLLFIVKKKKKKKKNKHLSIIFLFFGAFCYLKVLFSTKESNFFLIAKIHLFVSGEFRASE